MISRRALVAGSGALLLPKRARAFVEFPPTRSFTFPFGRAPGFDQNHVAMSGGGVCRFSGVPLGVGNFPNLLNGASANTITTPVLFYRTGFPAAGGSTNAKTFVFTSGINFANDTNFTIAMIATTSTTGTHAPFQFGSGTATVNGVGAGTAAGTQFQVNISGTNSVFNVLTIGMPYFLLGGRRGTTGTNMFAQTLNMATGQMIQSTASSSATLVTPTEVDVCTSTATSDQQFTVGAVAYLSSPPNFAVWKAWALDPWSFWYPNRLMDMTQ